MLYIYYMKIKISYTLLLLLSIFIPCLVSAQVTVVRVQDQTVYLDTSSLNQKVRPGDLFKLILSTEKLINPKTGKDLGDLYHYSEKGKITEVQPLYAVGLLPQGVTAQIGQDAVIEPQINPALLQKSPATITPEVLSSKNKLVYAPVDQMIVGISEGPILHEHAQNIVTLSDKGLVTVWTRANEKLRENVSYQLPPFRSSLAISAIPLSHPETADIFVTYFDTRQNRIFTDVLRYEEQQLKQVSSLPYYVKEHGCGTKKTLWAQKTFVTGSFPGNAHQLVYENNKFVVTKDSWGTQRNWLSSALWFPLEKEGEENFIYTASNGKITAVLSNGKTAESKDLFSASPNRVKYKQNIVKFYPALQVFGSTGNAVIAGVENKSKLGLLSSTFGQYQNGKIYFLSLEKGRLQIKDAVELDGVVYDTACTTNTLLTAEVLPNGSSSIVEIFN